MPRIALIHALEASRTPIHKAFDSLWPEAEVFDLLDSSLSDDLARTGKLDQAMINRFLTLGNYAARAGAEAILFTCSAFGPAIDAVKASLDIPVLRPNEAAFRAARAYGTRLGLLVTYPPSLPALSSEISAMHKDISLTPVLADGALEALLSGDTDAHDRAVLEAAKSMPEIDTLILGQFSLSRSAPLLQQALTCPVLTTPESAVADLKQQLGAGDS